MPPGLVVTNNNKKSRSGPEAGKKHVGGSGKPFQTGLPACGMDVVGTGKEEYIS